MLVSIPVERGKFFRAPRRLGALQSLKNTEKGVPDGFFLTSNIRNIHFRVAGAPPGPCWDPAGGAYDAHQTSSRVVRGHPSRRFLTLDDFSVLIWAHTE